MNSSLPGSSVHEISQARLLEWIAISFSRGSSRPMDWTHISCIDRWVLYHWATREAHVQSKAYIFKENCFWKLYTEIRIGSFVAGNIGLCWWNGASRGQSAFSSGRNYSFLMLPTFSVDINFEFWVQEREMCGVHICTNCSLLPFF